MILFALQGKKITSEPLDVVRIALPLLAYFAIMWFGGFAIGRRLHLTYPRTAALAFSAASNDFELAIAVAIGVFGVTSGQALAGVVGPLIEVPVLVGLVYVALWARRRFYPTEEVRAMNCFDCASARRPRRRRRHLRRLRRRRLPRPRARHRPLADPHHGDQPRRRRRAPRPHHPLRRLPGRPRRRAGHRLRGGQLSNGTKPRPVSAGAGQGPGAYRAAGRAPGFAAVAAGRCGAVRPGSGGSWGADAASANIAAAVRAVQVIPGTLRPGRYPVISTRTDWTVR